MLQFTFPLLLLISSFHFPLNFGQPSRYHRFGAVPHNLLTFPNPRAITKLRLNAILGILSGQMPFICDPDAILSSKERGKLNGELVELAKRIEAEKENGGEECGWGIYLGIAIVNQQFYNHFQQKESVEDFIRQKWALDPQPKCRRNAQLILVAKNCQEEKECIFASIDPNLALAIPKEELAALIGQQNALLHKGHFGQSLSNIVVGIQRISIHRIHIFSGKFVDEMPRPTPFPLLILAFLLILVIWEFGKMSIQPKLKELLEARKMRKREEKKEIGKGELADGDDGNGQERGKFLPQISTAAVDPPNEQIEMIEQKMGSTNDENGCFKFTKQRSCCRKPQSSLQIYQVEENC